MVCLVPFAMFCKSLKIELVSRSHRGNLCYLISFNVYLKDTAMCSIKGAFEGLEHEHAGSYGSNVVE